MAGVLHGSEGTVQVSEVVVLQGGPASSLPSLPHHEGLEVVRAVGEVLQDLSELQGLRNEQDIDMAVEAQAPVSYDLSQCLAA